MTYLEAYSPQDKRNEYNKSLVNVSSHKKNRNNGVEVRKQHDLRKNKDCNHGARVLLQKIREINQ